VGGCWRTKTLAKMPRPRIASLVSITDRTGREVPHAEKLRAEDEKERD
jgi:hypothetical protein